MAEQGGGSWESPPEEPAEAPRERRSSTLSASYKPSAGAVKRGGNPLWPLFLVLLLLGGAAFAAVTWLTREETPARPAPAEREAARETPPAPASAPVSEAAREAAVAKPAQEAPPPAETPRTPPARKAPAAAEPLSAAPAPAAPSRVEDRTARRSPPTAPGDDGAREPVRAPAPTAARRAGDGPLLAQPEPPAELAAALAALAGGPSEADLAVLGRYAEAGWPQAETGLALALATGAGGRREVKKALALFKQAAEQDDAEAQYHLGDAYLKGTGVEADPVEALAWFILAATHGHAEALAERDRGLASVNADDRARAFNRARNLGPDLAAGWSRDPASGTRVWLPSWYRTGSYVLRLEVPAKDGRAEGQGRLELKASLPGDSDRVFEGRFSGGHYFGKHAPAGSFHFLETNDFLYRLPDSEIGAFRGVAFWLRVDFGVDFAADPCYLATNRTPDLVAAVPAGFPALEDESAKGVMAEAWRLYQTVCPKGDHAHVTVTPAAFGRERDRFGHRVFGPRLATARFYGKRGETLSVGGFENQARRAHETEQRALAERRKREAREEKRRRAAAAAPGRGNPDVRGLRLGMTLAEVHAHFADEIADWQPPWKPERPLPPFSQFQQKIKLADGTRISARFTSPVNGSVLFALAYEQDLRDGPPPDELARSLVAKYGEPDDRGTGGIWWSYELVSRVDGRLGAFMKVHYRVDRASNRVQYLRLVINDHGFGRRDERAAYDAKVEAERRAYEAGKAAKPKF